jgi:hypothetical protein
MVVFGIYTYSTWFENVLGFDKGMVGQIDQVDVWLKGCPTFGPIVCIP